MRAPFLQTGGNNMFEMLYETNFTYDSSLPVQENHPAFWPYTLDYALSHSCNIPPCPTKSFPGMMRKKIEFAFFFLFSCVPIIRF